MTMEELENCRQRFRNVCITDHPSFEWVYLDSEVLEIALVAMQVVHFEDSSNRSSAIFQLAAYCQLTRSIHTRLGCSVRQVISAGVVAYIQQCVYNRYTFILYS